MITVKDVRYAYSDADKDALQGIDFSIKKGEVFGFLGPSGAGKSTMQKLLIGLLKHYRGSIEVMGKEVRSWGDDYYEHVGVSFELPNHYLKLTACENLEFFRSLYRGKTIDPMTLLSWVGLQDAANKKVAAFSKGMKVRLNVARSLLHQPKILFLDEPTSGLDPVNARKIKDLILKIRNQGTTVFITTHNMMVADELCDRVAFITDGSISLIDTPSVLKKKYGKREVRVEYLDEQNALQSKDFSFDTLGWNSDFCHLIASVPRIETIHTQETTLENIFIQVTGQELG